MTLEDLNSHYALIVELKKAQDMLQSLWSAAYPGGKGITGMPHTPGVKDKVGDLAADIADLETDIEAMQQAVKESEAKVSAYVSGIQDVQIRMIFRLRFCRGYKWKEVAQLLGGGNSEDSVKRAAYRYLGQRIPPNGR